MFDTNWHKSSYSGKQGNCVEVRRVMPTGVILVRNTRDHSQGTLAFTPHEWDAFVKGTKDGEFDLPEGAV